MNSLNELWLRWMTDGAVQLSVLIILVGAVAWLGRRLSARWRYALWTLVLVKALLPPFWSVPFSVVNLSTPLLVGHLPPGGDDVKQVDSLPPGGKMSFEMVDEMVGRLPPGDDDAEQVGRLPPGGDVRYSAQIPTDADIAARRSVTYLTTYLWFIVWLGGALLFWTVMLYRYAFAVRLLGKGCAVESGPLIETLDRLRKRLGVRSRPRIVLSSAVGSPFLWGLWRPSIALPAEFPGETSATELETVLLHELTHWKRGDLFVAQLELFVQGIFWFHPLVWAALWQLRRERESACDEAVLATGCIEANRYGDSLVNVLSFVRDRSLPAGFLGVAGILERKTQLQQRLEEIMRQRHHVKRIGLFGWALLLFFAVCVLPMAITTKPQASARESAEAEASAKDEEAAKPQASAKEDGGFVTGGGPGVSGFTHLIVYGPKEGFVPKNPMDYLNISHPKYKDFGVYNGYFRTRVEEGKLIAYHLTGTPTEFQKLIESIPQFEYIRTERLTKESFEAYEKTQQESLPPADGGFISSNGNLTHLVVCGPTGDFVPKNFQSYYDLCNKTFVDSGAMWMFAKIQMVDEKYQLLSLTDDPEKLRKAIESLPQLEYLHTERLTKEMFEEHIKPWVGRQVNADGTPRSMEKSEVKAADGGFATPQGGFTHKIVFGPKGDFVPKNPMDYMSIVNPKLNEFEVHAGYFRSKPEDGKLIAYNLTSTPDEYKKVVESIPQFEYLRTERLTKESFEAYEKTQQESLPPTDGGYSAAGGFTHLVVFRPKGDFNPQNPGPMLEPVRNALLSHAVHCGYFRTKPEDGKLTGMFVTTDPEKFQTTIESLPQFEFIRSERLTKASFEAYEKTPQLSLPNPEVEKRLEAMRQTDWYNKLTPGQKKWLEHEENAFAYVYDPKNYEVGSDRDAFVAKWVKLLEGPEPGFPGRTVLSTYDEAIFGLAIHKNDRAAELLVKIAAERVIKDNAHRFFATKALGILGDVSVVPDLIPLLYHYNMDCRLAVQISLVQLTGQNFGRDAASWGEWYNDNRSKLGSNLRVFDPVRIDWSCGSDDPQIKKWCDPEEQRKVDEEW